MAIDKAELRRVMGHFATGVTVITTTDKNHQKPFGLTANAVCSLSLEPPLVLICVDKSADCYEHFKESGIFNVNILDESQEDVSRRFATKGIDKFQGVSYKSGANGAPLLVGSLATLECRIVKSYDGGDHTIYLGEVDEAITREGRPLIFYRGGYRSLGD